MPWKIATLFLSLIYLYSLESEDQRELFVAVHHCLYRKTLVTSQITCPTHIRMDMHESKTTSIHKNTTFHMLSMTIFKFKALQPQLKITRQYNTFSRLASKLRFERVGFTWQPSFYLVGRLHALNCNFDKMGECCVLQLCYKMYILRLFCWY